MATVATTEPTLVLPDALTPYSATFERALATPMPWGWNEDGPSFIEADQPAMIARALIPAVHTHLLNRKIGYLFRERLTDRGRTRLAQASKVGGKLQHFARLDFLVEVNWDAYRFLAPAQKIALLDHELCHFDVDDDKTVLIAHDVEEFSKIVRRWGLWKLDLRLFNDSMKAAPRVLDLEQHRRIRRVEEKRHADGHGDSRPRGQRSQFELFAPPRKEKAADPAPEPQRKKGKKPARVADIVPGIAAGL